MNATQLFHQSGKPAGLWYCETCRVPYGDQDVAENCCRCRECGESCPRDTPGDFTNLHSACSSAKQRRINEDRLAKAEEVECHDGGVFVDGWGPQDGYFRDCEDAAEYIQEHADEDCKLPQWAFCCTRRQPPRPGAGDVVERMCDDLYDDAGDDVVGVKELQVALDAFWEANKEIVTWYPDYSRKIRLEYEN